MMSKELIERLRDYLDEDGMWRKGLNAADIIDAADTIEQQAAEIERLSSALSLAELGEFAGQAGQAHLSSLVDDFKAGAERLRFLINQDIENNFPRSGVFIGKIPDNRVLTGDDAIEEIDAAMLKSQTSEYTTPADAAQSPSNTHD
jgi:hypothetical protein